MKAKVRFLGLDVHAETIAVAVAEPGDEVRSLGTIANRAESIRKLVKKLGQATTIAQRHDARWHRQYMRLSMAKHHGVAKLAIAHKLAVRLYWMLRRRMAQKTAFSNIPAIIGRRSCAQKLCRSRNQRDHAADNKKP